MKSSGVWTAIVTPFTEKAEQIDWASFEKLIEMQNNAHVTGVVVCGTTGESPTLSVHEKLALVRKARVLLKKEIRLMAGTGGQSTDQTVELSKLAVDGGADSLLIVTPPYNKPSPAGLVKHFESIHTALPHTDVCLYHVPGRTAQFLSPATVKLITDIPNVTMLKEASADMSFFSRAREICKPACTFLSGDDLTFLPSLSIGGDGVISVLSNVFPKEFVSLYNHTVGGRRTEALKLHHAMAAFIDLLFVETNPGPAKAALSLMSKCNNSLRLPLVPVTEESYKKIKNSFEETQKRLREISA